MTYSEDWSAEIDLGKRRASPGTVDYAQDGGQVAVSGSGTFTYSHGCLSLDGYPTYNLPQQTLHVPREGLNDADFGVTFKLKLNGIGKSQYGLSVGAVQPEFSNIKGIGTVTCPEGTSHTEEYAFINTIQTVMALVEPGKVGDSPLNGSAQAGFHTVSWSLTVKK